jgi:hypothetical protein
LLGVAFYAALALTIEDARRKTVLPVLRVGVGKKAVEGSVEDQIEGSDTKLGCASSFEVRRRFEQNRDDR